MNFNNKDDVLSGEYIDSFHNAVDKVLSHKVGIQENRKQQEANQKKPLKNLAPKESANKKKVSFEDVSINIPELPSGSSVNQMYKTHGGAYYVGDSLELLKSEKFASLKGKVQLLLTSPPYPLNDKKSYGNFKGDEYLKWFTEMAPIFSDMLTPDGSIVIELGNSWEPERPVQSLLHLEALLAFTKHPSANLRLIQQFVCYNPSRLPSPAAWVTINRIRTVDSYTHVWWLAKSDFPKADNKKVLRPYSKSMKQLLKRGSYNAGKRPSEHSVSDTSFLKDNNGAIAHNFFEVDQMDSDRELRLPNAFSFANTASNDYFHNACKEAKITPHPARMPAGLASFFIQFLTDEGDLVLDPFGGSNTTGYVAALNNRKWVAIDAQDAYVDQSMLRFKDPLLKNK
jgi:DNA modification methylase